jgi:hypothetical protein
MNFQVPKASLLVSFISSMRRDFDKCYRFGSRTTCSCTIRLACSCTFASCYHIKFTRYPQVLVYARCGANAPLVSFSVRLSSFLYQHLKITACGHELGSSILFGRRIGFSGTSIICVCVAQCAARAISTPFSRRHPQQPSTRGPRQV